ncbi:hypothetical protein [uncultured Erythrobacter sp.]|uniref:hypothetical protein n=1 Tax=uncultured Erythrobacter sp. TaxID=263913 RepID=UPI002636B026|nr:hypothetical protein [uncultured Erythrobacter sp.]
MTELPPFLRRLPYVFYTLAILVGAWRVFNEISMINATYAYAGDVGGFDDARWIARSTAYYWGFVEMAYLVSSGAVIHVLVAIYDKVKGPGV